MARRRTATSPSSRELLPQPTGAKCPKRTGSASPCLAAQPAVTVSAFGCFQALEANFQIEIQPLLPKKPTAGNKQKNGEDLKHTTTPSTFLAPSVHVPENLNVGSMKRQCKLPRALPGSDPGSPFTHGTSPAQAPFRRATANEASDPSGITASTIGNAAKPSHQLTAIKRLA